MSFNNATAYSYIRFSSPEQAKGDSLRRQSASPGEWCKRHGATLSSQSFRDLGVSGYTGEHKSNPDRHGLALFLNALREQKISRDSLLIIENLDRLTRENLRPAFSLVNQILDCGIHIVTLAPERVYRHDSTGSEQMMDVMLMLVELSRGNQESARKSYLVGKAWQNKKSLARTAGHVLTHRLPAWISLVDGKLMLISEKAEIVKLIFSLSIAGYGHAGIVQKLTADGVAPISTGDKWSRSYVANILKDRRAIGEFQPKKRDGSNDGDVIKTYFPPVVNEDVFFAARGEAVKRLGKQGRNGTQNINIFAGLIVNARDGDSYYLATRTDGMRRGRLAPSHSHVLINTGAAEGRSTCYSFPYLAFETGILSQLREVNPAEVMGESPDVNDVLALSGELTSLESKERELEAALEEGIVAVVVKKLRELQERKVQLVKQLELAKARAASPLSEAWGEGKTLLDLISTADDKDDVRIRLRSVLRRIISQIYIVVFSHGKTRGAVVQINFAGANSRRYYELLHRGNIKGFGGVVKPATLNVKTATAGTIKDFDLTNPDHANMIAIALTEKLKSGELKVVEVKSCGS